MEFKKHWKTIVGLDLLVSSMLTIMIAILAGADRLNVAFGQNMEMKYWVGILFICSFLLFGAIWFVYEYLRCSCCRKILCKSCDCI